MKRRTVMLEQNFFVLDKIKFFYRVINKYIDPYYNVSIWFVYENVDKNALLFLSFN